MERTITIPGERPSRFSSAAKKLRGLVPEGKSIVATAGICLIVAGVARLSVSGALILAGMMLFGYALITTKTK